MAGAKLEGRKCAAPPHTQSRKRNVKRAERVAHEVVRRIVERGMVQGDKLPLEAEMLVEYGVSRSSLREALRLLEVQGLISIRPGPGSGTEVGTISPANLASTLSLYLMMARANLGQLLDAWLMVETLLARLAASSPDRNKVHALIAPFASGASERDYELQAGLEFHDCVAELADNPLLTIILGAVGYLVTEQVRIRVPEFELSDVTIDRHTAIADAILAGDAETAANIMHQHLLEATEEISARIPLDTQLTMEFD
ncbi:MAG: FCD domain-containing protein [Novosphingobium sp.]